MLHLAIAAALQAPVIPIHGTVLSAPSPGHAIVRLDAVTDMVRAQTRTVRLSPALQLTSGTGIDAFLDRTRLPWRLYDASIAAKFVPGLPETGKVIPLDYGSSLPHARLVDQNGAQVDLANAFRGKVVLLSFIFTRCPDKDECPALSAQFAALQRRLDPQHFHLAEVTLDPAYDSPVVLARYAKAYGADAKNWSFFTGQPHDVQHLLDRFGISSLRVENARFIHNDKVFVTTPDGKIADIVQSLSFSSDALASQARHLAGMESSSWGRFKLAMVASAVAICGGSQFAGVVLLETCLFLIIAVCSFGFLGWVARKFLKSA